MNEFDQKRESFRQRLDTLSGQLRKDEREPESGFTSQEFEHLAAWQSALERNQAEFAFDQLQQLVADEPSLHCLDDAFLKNLHLEGLSHPTGFSRPVQYGLGREGLRAVLTAFGVVVPEGHLLPPALHLPGEGTFVTAELTQEINAADRAELLGQAVWARWGWDFLLEYTSLGQAAGAAGLWPALTALFLGVQFNDSTLLATAVALRRTWLLVEAGWLDWVWKYGMFRSRHAFGRNLFESPKSGRLMELVVLISRFFPLYLEPFGVRIYFRNLIELVRFLFLEQGDIIPQTLNSVLAEVESFCLAHDTSVREKTKHTLSQVLGGFYIAKLESAVGIVAMPHAIRIAFNLPDLLQGGFDQLTQCITSDPRQRVDTRLAMLSTLDTRVKYDPQAMSVAAWERLGL